MNKRDRYSALPQDDYHHHVKSSSIRPCCWFFLVTLVIIVVFGAAAAITMRLFYAAQFNHAIHTYLPNGPWDPFVPSTEKPSESTTSQSTVFTSPISSTPKPTQRPNVTTTGHFVNDNDSYWDHSSPANSTESSEEYSYEDINKQSDGHSNGSAHNDTTHLELFAKHMRDFEKQLEQLTGIRRAEFIIPLFMLVCFLSSLTLMSVCCLVMMKRRDHRRRQLFGKIITDLQTGDSKTVLLNQDDDD